MTNDLENIRRFRDEVPSPGSASWASGRAALDRAIAAERAGTPTAVPARNVVRPRWRAYTRRHRRLTAGVALAVVLAASAGIAAAAGVLLPDLTSPAPGGPASSPPSSLTSSFAVLRAPRRATDSLPAAGTASMTTEPTRHWGVNPNLSRFIGAVDGTRIWLVPGSIGSCIYGPGGGGSACGPNGPIVEKGLMLALVPVNGSAPSIIGITPDGASVTAKNADGSPAPVSRAGNAYAMSGDPNLRSFTVHDASGKTFTTPAPARAPAPQPPPKRPALARGRGLTAAQSLSGDAAA
jgi:hypothetical protein